MGARHGRYRVDLGQGGPIAAQRAGAGLAIHGAATGALWREAEAWRHALPAEQQSETQILLITENLWTNGVPKRDRLSGIAAVFNQYNPKQDRTGDIGDAIGLALWHIKERRVQLARYSIQEITTLGLLQ